MARSSKSGIAIVALAVTAVASSVFAGSVGGARSHGAGPWAKDPPERVIEQSVTYTGCNEVRALGKAPLHAGQPGYRAEMDGDGDGIACEPNRY